jgi:hypothetical protein
MKLQLYDFDYEKIESQLQTNEKLYVTEPYASHDD